MQIIINNDTISASGFAILDGVDRQNISLLINLKNAPTGTNPSLIFTLADVDPVDLETVVGNSVSTVALTQATATNLFLNNSVSSFVKVSWTLSGTNSPEFTGVNLSYTEKEAGDRTAITIKNDDAIEVYRNSSLNTGNNNVLTDLPWDTETFKEGITHSISSNAQNITITATERYCIFGQIKLNNALLLTSIRVALLVNNAIVADINTAALSGGETAVPVNNTLRLNVNDVVKVQVASGGVGSVSIITGATNTYLKIIST